ncbi:MAG: hypothetical protein IK137_00830 [Bacilli bacterium]|nr:hypothetical protein [Bacilli bacterium]
MTIEDEAREYIRNNLTVGETAEKLGISRKTFQIHLKKLGEINQLLNDLVLQKKESNLKAGRIKGGKVGKNTPTYTKEDANIVANGIIRESYTYEEAAMIYGVPKSTIYEMVHSDFVDEDTKMQLGLVAEYNNKNKNAKGNIIC